MKKIIALLDKEYPPNHSFVNGMLASVLSQEKDISVSLIVSKNKEFKVCRYKSNSVCLATLYPRKGIFRIINFVKIFFLIFKLKKKKDKKKIIFFVRNDPLYLLVCSFFKNNQTKLIFQSSFPHEEISGNYFTRYIAKVIYGLCKKRVDSLLAVSPRGLIRLKKLMPSVTKAEYIPLLSDHYMQTPNFKLLDKNEIVKFIYVGDHSKLRKLETVLGAIVLSLDRGLQAEFKFIGGEKKDIMRLSKVSGVCNLIKKGNLKFVQKISRNYLLRLYSNFDVGLSLIPPDNHYIEASPTKLTEYMGAGLAVLASKGIEMQEEIVEKSKGGLLCDWCENSIAKHLINISINRQELLRMKKESYKYASERFNYQNYLKVFRKLIDY